MFGERLQNLRKARGYSMDKLIELYNNKYDAKMNKSTLSRYENGIQDPIYTVVVNLADFFGVSVGYISGSEEVCSYMDISLRIKKFRKKLGLTTFELSKLIGVSEETLLTWESSDLSSMGLNKVELLAKVFGTTPGYLIGWTDDPKQENNENFQQDKKMEKCLDVFERLSDTGQEKVIDYASMVLTLEQKDEGQDK
ncbi:MAG: helix-turn-helix transcriptional regulator [Clostridia bacterium]|nr:helix-turn-helix transcriptional regulator [Clostridia bacterium]